MSQHHPIITVTGSSDRANENIRETFEHIFWREKVSAAFIDGSAYRRFDRAGFEAELVRAAVRAHGGGHATLIRADEATRAVVPVFQPEPAPVAELARRVKMKLDPMGILNPGRMAAGV